MPKRSIKKKDLNETAYALVRQVTGGEIRFQKIKRKSVAQRSI